MHFITAHTKFFLTVFIITLLLAIIISLIVTPFEQHVSDIIVREKLEKGFKILYLVFLIILFVSVVPLIPTYILNGLERSGELINSNSFVGMLISNKEKVVTLFTYSAWTIGIVGLLIALSGSN